MKTVTVLWMVAFTFALLTLGTVAPAAAWVPVVDRGALNDSQEPGSVLVFPKFRSGTVNTPDQGTIPITEFEISVACPKGSVGTSDCAFQKPVFLRAHWVCRGDSDTGICQESDFDLMTTVNGTLYLTDQSLTSVNLPNATVIPSPPDGCRNGGQGYLIVWVTDGSGNPIKFDSLIGDATLRGGSDSTCPTCLSTYNAIPIQASVYLNINDLTDVNGDGKLQFDGNEYQMVTGTIIGTVRYPGPTFAVSPPVLQTGRVETLLTLLTLDVNSNLPNDRTFVNLNFYNEGEVLHSTAQNFLCYQTDRLDDIDSFLTNSFGRKGLVVSEPAQQIRFDGSSVPATLLGLIENIEHSNFTRLRWAAHPLYNDSTPVGTTFTP